MTFGFRWRDVSDSICEMPIESVDLSQIDDKHPAVQFHHYWQGLAGGAVPARSLFSPSHVKPLLRWLMLFQQVVEGDEDKYLLTLQGTSSAELTHGTLQGLYLDQFTATGCYLDRRRMMRMAIETGEPQYGETTMASSNAINTAIYIGAFPFSTGGLPQIFMFAAPKDLNLRQLL